MEKCRHCGADRQDGHTYCPMCGKKLFFTVSDLWMIERRTQDIFLKKCESTLGLPPNVKTRLSWICWEFVEHKYGKTLRCVLSKDRSTVIPEEDASEALAALGLISAKAEELFGLILEY